MNRGKGDPCSGSHKHAIVKYHCEKKGTHLSKRVEESQDVVDSTSTSDNPKDVECPKGQTITVHHPVIFNSVLCSDNPLEQGKAYEAVNRE